MLDTYEHHCLTPVLGLLDPGPLLMRALSSEVSFSTTPGREKSHPLERRTTDSFEQKNVGVWTRCSFLDRDTKVESALELICWRWVSDAPRNSARRRDRHNNGSMPRGCCALCDAPEWLAAESVHTPSCCASPGGNRAISVPDESLNIGQQRNWFRKRRLPLKDDCGHPFGTRADIWAQSDPLSALD